MASSFAISSGLPRSFNRTALKLRPYVPLTASDRPSTQCRPFSQGLASRARGIPQHSGNFKMPTERSMKSRFRDMKLETMPTDLGLLPGTFIKPEGKDMPSFFKQPRERLQMEWVWAKTWVQSVIATVAYHKYFFKSLPLQIRERRKIAKRLHHMMYTEFARGNEALLRQICCDGLGNSLISRITNRQKGEKVSWNLLKYRRTPSTYFTGLRVLSDRATKIPEIPDSGIRQVVVRISSEQTTQSYREENMPNDKGGTTRQLYRGMEKSQNCTEYVVIQKLRIAGQERDWQIWGFTKPTTVEDLDSPWFATDMSLKERIQMMQEALSGKA